MAQHWKMTKTKKSIAGMIILVLVASACLRFHSWTVSQRNTEGNYGLEWSDDAHRHLLGQTIVLPNPNLHLIRDQHSFRADAALDLIRDQHSFRADASLEFSAHSESIVKRTYNELKRRGHTPGTKRFTRLLQKRATRKMEIHDLQSSTVDTNNELNKKERRATVVKELGEIITARDEGVKKHVRQALKEKEDIWLRGDFLNHHRKMWSNTYGREEEIAMLAEADNIAADELQAQGDIEPLTVCDRPADVGSVEDFASLQEHAQCTEITQDKPILILQGGSFSSYGRTGNNLLEFLHAIQMARDNELQLGVMAHSWAMDVIQKMWLAIDDPNWEAKFEQAFCLKIFDFPNDLQGWDVIHQDTKQLFFYKSAKPLGEYKDSQEYAIRTLFRDPNQGEGYDRYHRPVDMCSGIKSVFGEDRASAIYSVIHGRRLEGNRSVLGKLSLHSGCDPVAALEMRPDYIKSILEPLGMLKFPIVIITDGQDLRMLQRLMDDPELGPLIRLVPKESSWIGGDITLATMSNVFIGNPASSFSGFIAKARLSLGFGHSYLFRAKDKNGEWRTVCGDHCVFDKSIYDVMA